MLHRTLFFFPSSDILHDLRLTSNDYYILSGLVPFALFPLSFIVVSGADLPSFIVTNICISLCHCTTGILSLLSLILLRYDFLCIVLLPPSCYCSPARLFNQRHQISSCIAIVLLSLYNPHCTAHSQLSFTGILRL